MPCLLPWRARPTTADITVCVAGGSDDDDTWWEQSEMVMLEAQINGLKEEAAILQEQLDSKDEALAAVHEAVSQAPPRPSPPPPAPPTLACVCVCVCL
jgi:hypothetical protein